MSTYLVACLANQPAALLVLYKSFFFNECYPIVLFIVHTLNNYVPEHN